MRDRLSQNKDRLPYKQGLLFSLLGILILVSVLSAGLLRSRIGRAMVAVRDNETAAAVIRSWGYASASRARSQGVAWPSRRAGSAA